ncbi:hypothetical protein J1N35_038082, partial [Gossypium stocksii]
FTNPTVGPQSIGVTRATLGTIFEIWAHMLVWPTNPDWHYSCGPHGLAQNPHAYVAHTPNLAKPVWPTRPHSSHHMVVCCAWPCLRQPHGCVSYTPMWCRQNNFLAFVKVSFSVFQ